MSYPSDGALWRVTTSEEDAMSVKDQKVTFAGHPCACIPLMHVASAFHGGERHIYSSDHASDGAHDRVRYEGVKKAELSMNAMDNLERPMGFERYCIY